MRFRNVTTTIANGRRYVGLSKRPSKLPIEHWAVYALGLLFFEVVTGKCAVSAVEDLPTGRRIADTPDSQVQGALFAGIVGKATSNMPDRRYHNPQLFSEDVADWSELETALERHDIGEPRVDRVRRLWHIQLGLERRTHLAVQRWGSFLDAAPGLANYVLQELRQCGELGDVWLEPTVREVEIQEGYANPQVASLQAKKLATRLQAEWNDLTESLELQRAFTCHDWLTLAATANEIESVRRVLCKYASSGLRSVSEQFCVEIVATKDQRLEVVIGGREDSVDTVTRLSPELDIIGNRLMLWLSKPTLDPIWPTDLLVIAGLLLASAEGLAFAIPDANPITIGPAADFEPSQNTVETALALFKLYDHDIATFSNAAKDSASVHNALELALLCGAKLRGLSLLERQFGSLTEPALHKLYSSLVSELDLTQALAPSTGSIVASKSSLLPFPNLSPFHGKGCPFSADLALHDDTEVVALSLPPVAWRAEDDVAFPRLRKKAPRNKTWLISNVLSCLWGKHTLLLVPVLGLCVLQFYLQNTGIVNNAVWASMLDAHIPAIVHSILLFSYLGLSVKRFRNTEKPGVSNGANAGR